MCGQPDTQIFDGMQSDPGVHRPFAGRMANPFKSTVCSTACKRGLRPRSITVKEARMAAWNQILRLLPFCAAATVTAALMPRPYSERPCRALQSSRLL